MRALTPIVDLLRYWRACKPSPTTWLPILAIVGFGALAWVGLWSLIVVIPMALTALYVVDW